jgi:hypothetical protein
MGAGFWALFFIDFSSPPHDLQGREGQHGSEVEMKRALAPVYGLLAHDRNRSKRPHRLGGGNE